MVHALARVRVASTRTQVQSAHSWHGPGPHHCPATRCPV